MSGIHRFVSIGAMAVSLGWASVASAGDAPSVEDIKAAEADFTRGREAFKQGSYSEAGEYFESADGHAPNDKVLGLAIQAREKAAQLDRAATLAQLGLELYPDSEKIRKLGAPLVDRARAELLTVTVECSEPCSVLDGPRLVHGAPALRRTFFVAPGEHTIRAVWSEDRGLSQNVTGKAGDAASAQFTAPPIPEKPAEPAPVAAPLAGGTQEQKEEPRGLSPLYFWIAAGTTAVLGGVTVWSGLDTVNNPGADVVRRKCAGLDETCPEYKDGRSRQLRTNILIGVTSVVAAGTAVLGGFGTNWSGSPAKDSGEQAGLGVAPWVSLDDGGAAVGALGRF